MAMLQICKEGEEEEEEGEKRSIVERLGSASHIKEREIHNEQVLLGQVER